MFEYFKIWHCEARSGILKSGTDKIWHSKTCTCVFQLKDVEQIDK